MISKLFSIVTFSLVIASVGNAFSAYGATPKAQKPQSSNLIVNGSFERCPSFEGDYKDMDFGSTGIFGWLVTSGNIGICQKPYWNSINGSKCVELNGNAPGAIAQTISTEPGAVYKIKFALAANVEGGPALKKMYLKIGEKSASWAFDTGPNTKTSLGWTEPTWQFTAREPKTTIEFGSRLPGAHGALIDNVSVEKVRDADSSFVSTSPTSAASTVPAGTSAPTANAKAMQNIRTDIADNTETTTTAQPQDGTADSDTAPGENEAVSQAKPVKGAESLKQPRARLADSKDQPRSEAPSTIINDTKRPQTGNGESTNTKQPAPAARPTVAPASPAPAQPAVAIASPTPAQQTQQPPQPQPPETPRTIPPASQSGTTAPSSNSILPPAMTKSAKQDQLAAAARTNSSQTQAITEGKSASGSAVPPPGRSTATPPGTQTRTQSGATQPQQHASVPQSGGTQSRPVTGTAQTQPVATPSPVTTPRSIRPDPVPQQTAGATRRKQLANFLKAAEEGIVEPSINGKFEPEQPITRADFVRFLVRIREIPVSNTKEQTFSDVPPSHPCFQEIEAAVKKSLVKGFNTGKPSEFRPEQPITREEFADMYCLFAGKNDKTEAMSELKVDQYLHRNPSTMTRGSQTYKDVADLSEKYTQSVAMAHRDGALARAFGIDPYSDNIDLRYFHPAQTMTRAEALSYLMEMYSPLCNASSSNPPAGSPMSGQPKAK